MESRQAKSFKQLSVSVEKLPALLAEQQAISEYAAERATLLLHCYRTGDANDPDTYVAAIAATLAHFPVEVITEVTHPVLGLPSKLKWLPSVKEVFDACETAYEPIKQREAREKRIKEQLAAREAEDSKRDRRPSYDDLKAKYGETWGIDCNPRKTDPKVIADENRAAKELQMARVRAEYLQLGMEPPSPFALSVTALKELRIGMFRPVAAE